MERSEARGLVTRGESSIPDVVFWRLDGSDDTSAPLVLCLHGMWMDEDSFAILLQSLFELPYRFLIPRGPLRVANRGVGDHASSWYRYDGDQDRFRQELLRTESLLLELLRRVEAERALAPRARVMLGFSQGGYCGSFAAVRNPDVFKGMIVSGARVKTEILEAEMRAAGPTGFRALLCHGERDPSVPPEAATGSRDALVAAGVDVELRTFDSGHAIGKRQVAVIGEWLQHRLDRSAELPPAR
jgi:predicted esterase